MAEPVALKALPPEEALSYFRSKGLAAPDARFDYRDVWRSEHASSFVVAKAMQDDVLSMIRDDLTAAMAGGKTFEQWSAEIVPKLQKAGWWGEASMTDPLTGETDIVRLGSMRRLRVIFDTNMRTSMAAGRWARIQRSKHAFPYLRYRQLDRPSKRPEHARFDGGVWAVDDPVWTWLFPPNGYFCACSVEQITQGQIDRGEVTVSDPLDPDEIDWLNKRTGEIEQIPDGITPGFDTNPGMIWVDMSRAMEGMAGPKNHAVKVGLATQLRLNMFHEKFERGVFIDNDGALHYPVRASSDRAGAISLPEQSVSGMDFIHSHITEHNISPLDLAALFDRKLRTMTALTRGGNIFSVAPAIHNLDFQAAHMVVRQAIRPFMSRLRALPKDQASLVINEVYIRYLVNIEAVDYFERTTGAHRANVRAVAELIEAILDKLS